MRAMAVTGPLGFRSESRAPSWSEAGSSFPAVRREREEQVNRILSTLASRGLINVNMVMDLVNDVMASDIGERPADLVSHIMQGIRERGDFNRARMQEIRRNVNELTGRIGR